MGSCKSPHVVLLLYVMVCIVYQSFAFGVDTNQTAKLLVDASEASGRPISETMFGIFFEEINHAGAGGLWAELVSNRGFEAGGPNVPSNIDPWSIIGNESSLIVSTDRSSCFDRNKVALRMEVLCDSQGANSCPDDGVGIYNPGFWGMNIEKGKTYSVVLYVRSSGSINVSVSLMGSDGLQKLAAASIIASGSEVSNWKKFKVMLEAQGTNPNSRLQLTTTRKGFIWFDQVSVMPLDTYKGHGFRKDLAVILEDLKPQFMRFPGGSFVEGEWLRNAFRWKETIGPWEERPGHFADVWMYWTDDGLGYFEFLQLAEDLGTLPIWVFNNGISHNDQVDTASVLPFVQEALDGLEFARGNPNSTWGSLRAAMGHPEPFDLRYVGIGNEDCGRKNYLGNYLKFYSAIKRAYPDIKIISNCDGSSQKLDHPADLFDFHFYTDDAKIMSSMAHQFDHTSRSGPKAFVSEYAVTTGSLLAALGEAGFLIGLEKNSDVVEMASYAPLFSNDRRQLVAGVWGSRFKEWVFSPSLGRSGGIAVLWNSQSVSVIDSMVGEFSVSIRIEENIGTDWWLSGIYGPCRQRERNSFWEELADLYGYCGDMWCLGGDFNVVRFSAEKSNEGRVTKSMRDFNDFIQETNLRDPILLNASFTWSNLRENAVCRRLDRFLVSGSWEEHFPHYRHKALPRITSDHCPIELDTSRVKWGPSPFRFENMWLNHPDFKRKIKLWWGEDQIPGWEGYKFMTRLKMLKSKLKVWSKEEFGDVERDLREAEARLLVLDQREGTEGLDHLLRSERDNLLLKIGDLAQKEEVKWRQRGKVKWAREGDGNTKFFHRVANGARKRNYIEKLEVEDLGVIEVDANIEREVIRFFKGLYSSNKNVGWGVEGLNWCPISQVEADWLERPFDLEEVQKAVFDCGKDKSPGPDGFSMSFFQSCWEVVKGDLMKVMQDFFQSGIVNGVTNETFICLIPKKANSVKVTDYRPISLVTSLYKVISKVLASRLREVLGNTISQSQGAFVQKRQILDAVLVANEVVEEVRKQKRKGLVFKIDFEKAYDHVEWNFVDDVMARKGFGVKWRGWIIGCLESVNFSIMINGKPRGKFRASRGLRQGDPLSPFLFTLVSDVLSRLIERAQDVNLVHGIVSGHDQVEVSHLQFADDTIFLLDGKEEYWLNLLQLLKLFCDVSGMKINKAKSCILGINFSTEVLNNMAGSWGCEVGCWPMVYLGLPLGGNPRALNFWNPVMEKVEKRLQNWKRACLSKGGRLTLIQAVLSSIPSYYMSLFKMPIGVAAKVEQLMRNFLWEGLEEGKKCHLVRWERVTKSKEEGGLGIGSLRERNEALRAKWLWRFPLETNSLWHRIIKSKYGIDSNGWDTKRIDKVSCRNPWREISKGYNSFLQCCRFSVGNGEKIRFWEDLWLKEGILKDLFPRLSSLSRRKNQSIACFANNHVLPLNWDFDFRRNLSEAEIAEVVILLDILGNVRLYGSRPDRRSWEVEEQGSFSCKSFRSFLLSTTRDVFPPFSSIWKAKTPPKIQFFVWLAANGRINTCDCIQRRQPKMCLSPSWCVLCKENAENIDHLFIHCSYSLRLWWKMLGALGVEWVIPKGCFELLSINLRISGKGKRAGILRDCLVHAIFWNIWMERNQRIFQGHIGVRVEELWDRIKFWASLWASVSGQFKDYHYSTIMRDMMAVLR